MPDSPRAPPLKKDTSLTMSQSIRLASLFLRFTLSASYVSAVADRLGFWGGPGDANVAWGTWDAFVSYTAFLNGFLPPATAPVLAWVATIIETVVALGLIAGWQLKWFALVSGVMGAAFCTAMTVTSGLKPPLDFSVFTVSAASFLLAATVADSRDPSKLVYPTATTTSR